MLEAWPWTVPGLQTYPREIALPSEQSAGEKYPREYGAMVEQYLRNLADDSTRGQPPPPSRPPASK
jgi:hypothetical protein